MLVSHQRYRIITDRAAIAAAIVLMLAQWLAPQPFTPDTDSMHIANAVSEATPEDQASVISFSDLMLDLGLLLFLSR